MQSTNSHLFIGLLLATALVLASAVPAPPAAIEIRSMDVSSTPTERHLEFSLSDGQFRKETLTLDPVTGALSVVGEYSFKDAATGRRYRVRYTADENGFRAQVSDLPSRHRIIKPPAKPQDGDQLGCALRNSLCG